MLTVQQALDAILQETQPAPPRLVDLAEALGLVLAAEAIADADSPPFDKAVMDGFAIRSADLVGGHAPFRILEQVTAGMRPKKIVERGGATRIMTGAPLPDGADAVVRIEDARIDAEGRTVAFRLPSIGAGHNIMRRGTSTKAGQCVVPAGRLLRPQEIGALAEIGRQRVSVGRRPRVAVLSTGDELVPIDQAPEMGQIRNSNEVMLCAQVRRAGGTPIPLGIARDDRTELRGRISAGLEADVLLLSGGVSEGTLDLVPSELAALGTRNVFHKVQLRPGKPLWFGIFDRSRERGRTYVFGLPGNPVSSLVCFELFVRTCLRRFMGLEEALPMDIPARLDREHVARGDRPTYNPARLKWDECGACVEPVRWQGSADLKATVDANAMIVFPAGDRIYPAGEIVPVIAWD